MLAMCSSAVVRGVLVALDALLFSGSVGILPDDARGVIVGGAVLCAAAPGAASAVVANSTSLCLRRAQASDADAISRRMICIRRPIARTAQPHMPPLIT